MKKIKIPLKTKAKIDAEVFIEIESEGNISTIRHKTELQDVSFNDFLTEEDKGKIIKKLIV